MLSWICQKPRKRTIPTVNQDSVNYGPQVVKVYETKVQAITTLKD